MLSDTDKLIATTMRRKGRSYKEIGERIGCERTELVRFFSTFIPEPRPRSVNPHTLSPDEKYLGDTYESERKSEAELAQLLWHKRMMGRRWDVRRSETE